MLKADISSIILAPWPRWAPWIPGCHLPSSILVPQGPSLMKRRFCQTLHTQPSQASRSYQDPYEPAESTQVVIRAQPHGTKTPSGILFGHKKEWSPNACHNTDEFWKPCSKWKKPDAKGRMWYDSIQVTYPEKANLQTQKLAQWVPGAGKERGLWLKGAEFPSEMMKMF